MVENTNKLYHIGEGTEKIKYYNKNRLCGHVIVEK